MDDGKETIRNVKKATAASSWWYANIDHTSNAVRDFVPGLYTGSSPNYTYPVYYSIASGDSAGLVNAISSNGPNGRRDNMWMAGQPRVIYLQPGTYLLNSTLAMYTDTVIAGDAINPPTLKAQSGFSGQYLMTGGDPGSATSGNGGELWFSVMLKNLILDTTANSANSDFTALSWRVAQNTALVNMQIRMPQKAHTGIWMGQGSALSVADTSFTNGNIGVHYAGLQQATLKNMKFKSCTTGIQIDNGFTVNIFAPSFDSVGTSIVLNSGSPWVSVVDGTSSNSGTFFQSNTIYPNFMIENISRGFTTSPMVTVGGTTKVGSVSSIGTYAYGNTYGASPTYQTNPSARPLSRPSQLTSNGKYPVLQPPQYTSASASDVINLKDTTQNGGNALYGNNFNDDTKALQAGINRAASQGKIAYLPYGTYRVTQTITIPSGTKLVGNAWSTISGYGSTFSDENNPVPIVQIGAPGAFGTAVVQDMRFTVGQALPGAIILQINMAGFNPGDVAVFNSLITVGGTRDTELSCTSEAQCRGALIGLHLSSTSSAYVENFWSWTADHTVDNSGTQTRIAAKIGVLVEATKGTWLVGLASEHWWLVNLSYHTAQNVFNSLFQSETNYFQGPTAPVQPPAPFQATNNAPSFVWCVNDSNPNCHMSVAQYFDGGGNLYQYGAASWNFFAGDQETMNVVAKQPTKLRAYGLCDHQATYIMQLANGTKFGSSSADGYSGSWGTLVAAYETS